MIRLDATLSSTLDRDPPVPSFGSNWFAPVLNIFRDPPDSPLARIDDRIAALRTAADSRIPALPAATRLAKMLFDFRGPTPQTLRALEDLQARVPALARSFTGRLSAIQAAAYGEAFNWGKAVEVTAPLYRRNKVAAVAMSSLAVIEKMHLFGIDKSGVGASAGEALRRSQEHEAGFLERLADRSVSIAVVGNSPIEIGRGQGAAIDRHDLVVRFNNYSADPAFHVDYGGRADIWVRAAGHTGVWSRPGSKFSSIVFSGPDRRHHGFAPWDILDVVGSGGNPVFVPTPVYVDLAAELQYAPSAGLTFLYWLRRLRGAFQDANVSVYGFALIDQPPGGSRHYFERPRSVAHATSSHNWMAEAELFQRILQS